MKYKFFYSDYCEGKEIPGSDPWEADKSQILHSMDCVLHMPDNFFGLLNNQNQCLQFMVKENDSVLIDIPITKDGVFIGSKSKITSLAECMSLVDGLQGDEDFSSLLPDEAFIGDVSAIRAHKKPWWKLW